MVNRFAIIPEWNKNQSCGIKDGETGAKGWVKALGVTDKVVSAMAPAGGRKTARRWESRRVSGWSTHFCVFAKKRWVGGEEHLARRKLPFDLDNLG